jgi:hypothetical protein
MRLIEQLQETITGPGSKLLQPLIWRVQGVTTDPDTREPLPNLYDPASKAPIGKFDDFALVRLHRSLTEQLDVASEYVHIRNTTDPQYDARKQELDDILQKSVAQMYGVAESADAVSYDLFERQRREAEARVAEDKRNQRALYDAIHRVLGIAEFIPIVQIPAGIANAALYAKQGRTLEASLSGIAALPAVGYLAKVGKLLKGGATLAKEGAAAAKLAKVAQLPEVAKAGEAVLNVETKLLAYDKPLVTLGQASGVLATDAQLAVRVVRWQETEKAALQAIEQPAGTALKELAAAEKAVEALPAAECAVGEKLISDTTAVVKGTRNAATAETQALNAGGQVLRSVGKRAAITEAETGLGMARSGVLDSWPELTQIDPKVVKIASDWEKELAKALAKAGKGQMIIGRPINLTGEGLTINNKILLAVSEKNRSEMSVTVTSKGYQIFVRGTDTEVNQVVGFTKALEQQIGKITELIHTQPGIRNVVPSLDDLRKNMPVTIVARGDVTGSIVEITYTVTEVRRLRTILQVGTPDAKRRFYQEMVGILAGRRIKPPDSMLAEMTSMGMKLPD